MSFLFKIELAENLEVEFEGVPIELAAALSLAATTNKELEKAILMASDHIRDEHRVKECQTKSLLNLNLN